MEDVRRCLNAARKLPKERFPLFAPRRVYPGFFGALFLILLRTAIGWHFLYEGVFKINHTPSQRDSYAGRALTFLLPPPSDKDKEPPFSAEGYLRNATGPLAPKFRGMIPDVNGMAQLDRDTAGLPTRLKTGWREEMDRVAAHFQFDEEQKTKAQKELDIASTEADAWFLNPENAQRIKKYYRDLRHVLDVEESPESLPYQREQAYKDRKDLDKTRKELLAEIDSIYGPHHDSWAKIATADQIKNRGELPVPWKQTDLINISTMWGLSLVGLCLMLGLFTPVAALGGAVYLLMFYLSMPPWPGLPAGPAAEGHYLFVNKNLIELLACLVLASTPNGLWIGLDALLFGWSRRREVGEPTPATPSDETPVVVVPVRGTIPRRS